MNYFEKIKNMSFEEMKYFIGALWADILANANKKGCCMGLFYLKYKECPIKTRQAKSCMYCYEQWLKSEVKE